MLFRTIQRRVVFLDMYLDAVVSLVLHEMCVKFVQNNS